MWKSAHVLPLLKGGTVHHLTITGLSNLTVLSKVLEGWVNDQLKEFLSANDILSLYQSGFRKQHDTIQNHYYYQSPILALFILMIRPSIRSAPYPEPTATQYWVVLSINFSICSLPLVVQSHGCLIWNIQNLNWCCFANARKTLASLPNIVTLQGSQVELVSQYKYIGILIDGRLTFKLHTEV